MGERFQVHFPRSQLTAPLKRTLRMLIYRDAPGIGSNALLMRRIT